MELSATLVNLLKANYDEASNCNCIGTGIPEYPNNDCPRCYATTTQLTTDNPSPRNDCGVGKDLMNFHAKIEGGCNPASKIHIRARFRKALAEVEIGSNGRFSDFFTHTKVANSDFTELIARQNPLGPNDSSNPEIEKDFLDINENFEFDFHLKYVPLNNLAIENHVVSVYIGDFATNTGNKGAIIKPYFTVNVAGAPLPSLINQFSTVKNFILKGDISLSNYQPTFNYGGYLYEHAPQLPGFVFDGYHFFIDGDGAGSGISVESGVKLKLINTIIEGCTTMWEGIENRGLIEVESSTIKDAQIGISISNTSDYAVVRNTTFENNNFGIEALLSTPVLPPKISFTGSTFQSIGAFKPPFSGQNPLPFQDRGYAGINVANVSSLNINKTNQSNNLFNSLHFGIIAQNSNLSVKHTTFENIEKLPGVPSLSPFISPGKAIYANGGSLSVTGAGILSGDPTTFSNCHTGIECFQASLTATQNKMRAMNTGITSYFGIFKNVSVTSNDVEAQDYGIHVRYATALANGCQVKDNIVAMSGNPDGVGIATGGSGDFIQFNGNFSSNFVTVQQGKAGIDMGVCGNVAVTQNTITLNNGAVKHGIGLAGGDKNTINCNAISGAGEKGIYGLMAGRSAYICNTTTGTGLGMHFEGVFVGKGSIPVAGNTMSNNAGGGLLMGADAVIGEQVHRGNKWTGGVTMAQHLGGANLAITSKFIVDAGENSSFLPAFVNPPIEWFENVPFAPPSYQCIPGPLCPYYAVTPDTIRETEIAKGELVGLAHQASQLWLAQRRLYERLTEEGNPYQGNPSFDSFLANAQANGIKGYGDLRIGTRQLYSLNVNDFADLDYYEEQIAANLDSLAEKELALSAFEITETDSTQLELERASILQNLANLSNARANKLGNLDASRLVTATTLLSQNNALSGIADHLLNEKTVNSIFLQTFAIGNSSFSEAQTTSLENIASQCPLSGGEAVLQARDMLALVQPAPVYYDDDLLCNPAPRPAERGHGVDKASTAVISIFPNPANDVIKIQYDLQNVEFGTLQFFNIYGRLVGEVFLPDSIGIASMPVDKLPTGVYFYSLDGAAVGRLIISH